MKIEKEVLELGWSNQMYPMHSWLTLNWTLSSDYELCRDRPKKKKLLLFETDGSLW